MAATFSPKAGTPLSEKSVYYDASDANAEHVVHAVPPTDTIDPGTDVTRKPSIATGALEPRDNANGSVRDSGYAPGRDTKEKRSNLTFPQPQLHDAKHGQVNDDQPSPAYVENGHTFDAGDHKATPARTSIERNTAAGPSAQPQPQVSPESENQKRPQTPSVPSDKERQFSGAFANGAAVTGPDAIPDDDAAQHQRTATAESQLSEGAKNKITKAEQKDAKRLLKVSEAEGKAQKANLSAFLKELSKLQTVQKQASKDESNAFAAHSKATAGAHKSHTSYLAAKAAHEQAEADLRSRSEALEAARAHAQKTTADLAVKTREAEELRRAKAVDDREREAKKAEILQSGKNKSRMRLNF